MTMVAMTVDSRRARRRSTTLSGLTAPPSTPGGSRPPRLSTNEPTVDGEPVEDDEG
jgi:hypothetical protein